jgi:hypothetical protein
MKTVWKLKDKAIEVELIPIVTAKGKVLYRSPTIITHPETGKLGFLELDPTKEKPKLVFKEVGA